MGRRVMQVTGLSKRYQLGLKAAPYQTLRETIVGMAQLRKRLFRDKQRPEEFWALRDISFDVNEGEVVGIVGHNGAGKSTLLKVLSRITEPTEGRADIFGRLGSLLEVGTGFHPELTGRENIFLNGAILGMRRAEITKSFDAIVAFAEVERFLDTPVKHYSSGMYIRLAFAVAAHLEPEILVVDEVLAVGDAAFQRKCIGKMSDVAREGRTVLFVSHNMAAVRSLCTRAVLLRGGRLALDASVDDVVRAYLDDASSTSISTPLAERVDRSGDGRVRAIGFHAGDPGHGLPHSGGPCDFTVEYMARDGEHLSQLYVGISIRSDTGTAIFCCTTSMTASNFQDPPERGRVRCHLPTLPLVPGRYSVDIKLHDGLATTDQLGNAAFFDVIDAGASGVVIFGKRDFGGDIVVPHSWRIGAADGVAA